MPGTGPPAGIGTLVNANSRVNAGSLAVVPEAQIEDKYIRKLSRNLKQAALVPAQRWNREGGT